MRLLENTLRILSIGGLIVGTSAFLFVAIFARLDESVTAIIMFLSVVEVTTSWMTLRYIKRSRMEIRRRELEFNQPNQWYSDRR